MKHRGGVIFAAGQRLAAVGGTLSPPSSIDGTGATNVSAALQAWIDAQPNGSTFNFAGKTYRCNQQLNLINRTDLTMLGGYFFTDDPTGDGSTLLSPSGAARNRSHWKLTGSTNIVVRAMTIRGPNIGGGYVAALEAQHGFDFLGSTNVEIDSCTISDIYGDWFDMSIHPVTGAWCDGINLHHNTLSADGRQGFSLTGVRNSIVQSNTCSGMQRAFLDLEPNNAQLYGCDNILIDSNTVGAHGLTFIASGGLGPVDNITISNNSCIGSSLWMIVLGSTGSRSNWTISNNTSDTNFNSGAGYVMELEQMVNVTVTNNTQPVTGATPMALAYFNACVGAVVQGNTIPGGTYAKLPWDNGSRYIRNCGNRFSASGAFDQPEVCVTNFGLATQYSGLTGWFDAYQATDGDLAAVSSMTDFSGNNRHLVSAASARPTFRTNIAGRQMRCYQFDGVDDYVGNTMALSQFITNSAYTVFMVFELTALGTGADNDAVWSDSAGVAGLYLATDSPVAYSWNVDAVGGDGVTAPLTLNKRTLIMMRHEGGNLYLSKDGGAESVLASGNTTTLAGLVRIGVNYLGTEFARVVFYTGEFFNVALTTAQILDRTNRLMIDWKVAFYYGAADTFTRANSAIGTSEGGSKAWQVSNNTAWSVVSNKAKLTTADSASGVGMAWIDCGLSDCTASVDIDAALGGSLLFRYQDNSNYNMLIGGGGGLYLFKTIGQSFTQIHFVSGLAATGTRQLKVVMSGSTVQSYYDGALVWTDTLTNCQNAVNHGLFQFATTPPACTWDNFLVTA